MQEGIGEPDKQAVLTDLGCDRFSDEGWVRTAVHLPSEMGLTIYVNQQELVTILCSPIKLNYLVLGFLYTEGIITRISDVVMMRVCEDDALADVRLKDSAYALPTKRTLASGCGGGSVFKIEGQRIESDLVVKPEDVLSLMRQMQEEMELYRSSGGVHTSALCDAEKLLVMSEDIGRHNTLDKIQGECLMRGIPTRDRLLLTTGRISSEILFKAANMLVPIVVSRHSPTGGALSLAHELGIALVGHVRARSLLVYSHPERLGRAGSIRADQA